MLKTCVLVSLSDGVYTLDGRVEGFNWKGRLMMSTAGSVRLEIGKRSSTKAGHSSKYNYMLPLDSTRKGEDGRLGQRLFG